MNNFRNYYIKYLYELFLTSKVNMQMFRQINYLFAFLAISLHHFGLSISDRGAKFCIIIDMAFTAGNGYLLRHWYPGLGWYGIGK